MGERTGQTPPAMMRSKESASGIPFDGAELAELTDSTVDGRLSGAVMREESPEET